MIDETISTDFLVLGSGIAGLTAALGLARHGAVLVVTKDQPTESNTGYAQGGVAAAMAPEDDAGSHLADTIRAGAGLVCEPAARVLVEEGPDRVRELCAWGARFDRDEGRVHFTREGAHSRPRVLHALGDATGWEMMRALLEKTRRTAGVTLRSFACSTDLVVADGHVQGGLFLTESSRLVAVLARATLLATGGAGQVFAETTNPAVATGDGIAMALRAGAAAIDLEFTQFHPTALAVPGAPRFLISEAVRGEGAFLLDHVGRRFTDELAPRDQVARAIFRERRRGTVFLDLRHLGADRVRSRFPRIVAECARHGVDLTQAPVPVTPAAHYLMGGVATDLHGRTGLPGLYAAGEVAGTGLHGANRLASNSLLEGLVFGTRAAQAMAGDGLPAPAAAVPVAPGPAAPVDMRLRTSVQRRAMEALGLERDAAGLRDLVAELAGLRAEAPARAEDRAGAEVLNLVDVAHAMARCALFREESRGGHYRLDHPDADDIHFGGHTRLARKAHGLELQLVPRDAPWAALAEARP